MSNTVNFRLGSDAGYLLQSIAQEKLFHEYDLEKAINTLKDSMCGISTDLVYRILVGLSVIETNEQDQMFEVVEGRFESDGEDFGVSVVNPHPNHLDFIKLNKWFEPKINRIMSSGRELLSSLEQLEYGLATGITVDVPLRILIDVHDGKDVVKALNEIASIDDTLQNAVDLINVARIYIEESSKVLRLRNTLSMIYDCYPVVIIDDGVPYVFEAVQTKVNNILTGDIKDAIAKCDQLSSFINSEIEYDKAIKSKTAIQPNDIKSCMDAGWISPGGDYYGMNGEHGNMLHNKIATLLFESGIISGDGSYDNNPDHYLNELGWIKVHKDWVLFDGDFYGIQITKHQMKSLEVYGQFCCGGMLRLGLEQKNCSAAMMGMISPATAMDMYFKI